MTTTSSGLPCAGRRAVSALCVLLGLLSFSAPVPVAVADEAASPVIEAPAPAPAVSLEGSPTVGSGLRAVFSGPQPAGTLSYQFLRDGEAQIPANPWPYYAPQDADFGKRMSVRVTATSPDAEPIVLTSEETEPVLGYLSATLATDAMPVLGTELGVKVWTSTRPVLSQADVTIATAWFRNGTPIPDAPARYTVAEADMGAQITAETTLSAPGYRTSTVATSFGTAYRGLIQPASAPVITVGTSTAAPYAAYPGQVLKASAPAVTKSASTPFAPAPGSVTYTYQWRLQSPRGGVSMIPGATASTYTVRTEDVGRPISVYAHPVSANFIGSGMDSGSLQVYGKFAAMSAPTIKGTALAGQLLTAVPGPVPTPAPDAVSYYWYRDGGEISGPSTDPTYRLTTVDAGHKITARIQYEKANYDGGLSPASAAVAPPGYFYLGATPLIIGTAATGYTVSARTSPTTPTATSVTYQWYRDGKPIAGATRTSYRLTAADQWHQITYRMTFKRAGFVNATQTSRAIRPLAVFTRLPTPVVQGVIVRGAFTPGQILRASTALPSPVPTSVSWQWQREGRPIAGATSSSYRLTANDRDKFIRVVVTFKKPNYLNTARASASRWVIGPSTV
ncbi:hypothetical protein ACFRAU_04535 [Arthrobacter sp. NPDC056691]|uniref:hypothetical protein n=1 Tax=Arthrobacter sp. NPDC056691 TaxID=3345913 RepID=UPI00366C16A1